MKNTGWFAIALFFVMTGCSSTKPTPVSERVDPKYQPLRGTRYVIYVATTKGVHSEPAIEIENRIKSKLTDRGLVIVDFDSTSLANILKADGGADTGQTKRVSANADLIITGRISEEELKDPSINKTDTFRSRIRGNFAITETNSAIERGRVTGNLEEIAATYDSALLFAATKLGEEMGEKITEKLLYAHEK